MGHVFISYSHRDTAYAHALAGDLQSKGLDVWIDERLDYGSQWPHELQKQLDGCSAFILIMSPRSYDSEWVQSELQRARRKLKPIFPLLLEGDEPWLSVESTQFYDVRGGRLPDAKFYTTVRQALSAAEIQGERLASGGHQTVKPAPPVDRPRFRTGMAVAAGAGILVLLGVAVSVLRARSPSEPEPAASAAATSTSEGESPTTAPTIPISAPGSDSADFTDSNGMDMRLVPAGNFIMGSDRGYEEEKPVHTVYLDDFYIDKYEVTNAAYRVCVEAGACQPPDRTGSFTRDSYYGNPEYDSYPVAYVSWEAADSYCKWRDMGLPTEAQWEKAARGTDGRTYPWGESIDSTRANYEDNLGDTSAAGVYENGKSPYGVYDMAGNVWEWVADRFSSTYYLNTPLTDPPGPDSGEYRVLRGGSWHDDESIVRASNRGWSQLEYFYNVDFGFRCALDGRP